MLIFVLIFTLQVSITINKVVHAHNRAYWFIGCDLCIFGSPVERLSFTLRRINKYMHTYIQGCRIFSKKKKISIPITQPEK